MTSYTLVYSIGQKELTEKYTIKFILPVNTLNILNIFPNHFISKRIIADNGIVLWLP